MTKPKTQVRMKLDGYTRFCLTAITVLLTVLVLGLWAEGVPSAQRANAAAQERYQPQSTIDLGQLLSVAGQTNQKLDEIKKLLESGSAKVQVVSDASSSGPSASAGTGTITIIEGEGNASKNNP